MPSKWRQPPRQSLRYSVALCTAMLVVVACSSRGTTATVKTTPQDAVVEVGRDVTVEIVFGADGYDHYMVAVNGKEFENFVVNFDTSFTTIGMADAGGLVPVTGSGRIRGAMWNLKAVEPGTYKVRLCGTRTKRPECGETSVTVVAARP
jgi:hypothetical protein